MAKIGNIQEVAIEKLRLYERNAKKHPEEQVNLLCRSIQEYGFLNPCLIDKNMNVIAGHGRIEAAKKLNFKKVPCLYVEGLTDAQRRAYILADNRLTEMGSWDMALVSEELKALDRGGFDINLTGFIFDDVIVDVEPIMEEIDTKEIEDFVKEEETITTRGELWQLGAHRLLVGDSTDPGDVQRLTDGVPVDLLETDPPYNVAISNSKGMTIANDDMRNDDFYMFLTAALANATNVLKPGGAFYIWHADLNLNGLIFRQACEDVGLTLKQNLIWVKNHFTLGRQDYQWMHEPCLYGWKEGATHYFSEKRNIPTIIKSVDNLKEATKEQLLELIGEIRHMSTVEYVARPDADDLHPTMKPLDLILKQIKNSSQVGDVVLDLFGGSGTTLIACEKLGRRCFMMEYEPKYADVIIRRWEEETKQKAKRISDNEQ